MTTTTAAPPRARRAPVPFDPTLATADGEQDGRLVFRCPSRRPNQPGYLLVCDEDGGRPFCACDGATFAGHCLHMAAAPAIVRVAYTDLYAAWGEAQLAAEDRRLVALLGPALGCSLRYGVLGDRIAQIQRMADRYILNLRGERAKLELFGGA